MRIAIKKAILKRKIRRLEAVLPADNRVEQIRIVAKLNKCLHSLFMIEWAELEVGDEIPF